MKLCQTCGQSLAEEVNTCPSCGSEVREGRRYVDDYRIEEVLHEGHASILCRAVKEGEAKPVMIRLFTAQSGVNEEVANRLKRELEELKKLPPACFVSHREIRQSSDGLWYRVSEWVDAENWGDLLASGRLSDYRVAFDLFSKMASILDFLHQRGHFIPHLILNDIMVIQDDEGKLDVKIDYKLSRFFDPKLDRPGPMLKQLLGCHPDIINERPLDFRSDIWSLGKIFVQILTAEYETCEFVARIDELPLPQEVEILLKTMLADDPDLRPRSMREVAEVFNHVTEEDIEEAERHQRELLSTSAEAISRLRKRQTLLVVLVILLVLAAGGLVWYQLGTRKKESSAILEDYANQYAPSLAFLVVEYWLQDGEVTVYRSRAEGTAFLADPEGYLLSNRHVACSWLEDQTLFTVISQLKGRERSPQFGYRMLLWFEGEKAFNRSAGLMESSEVADVYFLSTAFRTDGTPGLRIAGVARPPVQTRQLIASPLKDDFAVLKIDEVPRGLKPLPLDLEMDTQKVRRLSRVVTLGFPLGSQTQGVDVNVSVSRGHVRRSFENLLQIDASFYGGSSGGPVIDMRGKVIGIASGVAMDRTPGPLPMTRPLWNMAMVLPITKATVFLQDLKAGHVKWNGVLDLSVEAKLKRITDKATEGLWGQAMALTDEELRRSFDPLLVMAGGMMHFCAGDAQGAMRFFGQSLSMDAENSLAALMHYLIDCLAGRSSASPHRETLLALDWRSPAEFIGYLVQGLEGLVDEESALKGWDAESEKSWLHFVFGIVRAQRGELIDSERLLREAVLAADASAWEFFVARAKLEEVQRQRLDSLEVESERAEYQAGIGDFNRVVERDQARKGALRAKLFELAAQLPMAQPSAQQRRQILEKILEIAPGRVDVLVQLVFTAPWKRRGTEPWNSLGFISREEVEKMPAASA